MVLKPHLVPVDVEGVVVEPGVPYEGGPLVPTVGDSIPVVLVQIFAEVTWNKIINADLKMVQIRNYKRSKLSKGNHEC